MIDPKGQRDQEPDMDSLWQQTLGDAAKRRAAEEAILPWVAVTTRLPAPGQIVVVWRPGDVGVAARWQFGDDPATSGWSSPWEPTHWMALPAPPLTEGPPLPDRAPDDQEAVSP